MRDPQKRKLIAGSIILILTISFLAFFLFSDVDFNQDTSPLSISFSDDSPVQSDAPLGFCSNKEQCYNYLEQQGMPSGFLESSGYDIICSGGVCYAK